MNKHLWAALCLATIPATTSAEKKPLVLTTYAGYNVNAVSPNGHWATGTYEGGDQSFYAFRWNLLTGQIDLLTSNGEESEGNSVSDEGIVAVTFYDSHATTNGAPVKSGGWWDGTFHSLPTITGKLTSSIEGDTRALNITPDATYLCGTSLDGSGKSVGAVWKNGQLDWYVKDGIEAYALAVSPDGQTAVGWSTPEWGGGGRVTTLWKKDGTVTYLSNPKKSGPWFSGRCFSADGTKMLYWRDYDYPEPAKDENDLTGPYAIYDMETGKSASVYTKTYDPFNIDLGSMANDGTAVGYEQPQEDGQRATIAVAGRDSSDWLEDYLVKEKGVDLSQVTDLLTQDGVSQLYYALGISADGQVIVARYYDKDGYTRSVAFNLSYEYSFREPVELQASQLAGAQAVKLEWQKPLTEADKVKSYNIYRNGAKVGSVNADQLTAYDAVPALGAYKYSVSAVYEAGESTQSAAVTASVKNQALSAPQNLSARQARLNDARLEWERPASNLTAKRYYDDGMQISGFGAGVNTFEGAVRFEKADLAYYKGKQLRAVSFYPMSEQKSFTLNIYKKGAGDQKPQLLLTQPVTQALNYGKRNTVKLAQPMDLPADADLYVALSVVPADGASDNVLGVVYGLINPGLADMARLAGEDDFYSIYEKSVTTGNPFTFTYAIDALLADDSTPEGIDDVASYNVYDGNALVATTTETQAEAKALADGTHNLSVEAVYADGRVSGRTSTRLDVTARKADYYKPVATAAVTPTSETAVKAEWQAPVDNDATFITYAGNQTGKAVTGPESNKYTFQAAVDYPASKLKGYEGYQLKSLSFYPLHDCEFTLYLYADGQKVADVPVDDYTLNQWNEVALDSPVTIESGKSYRLVVDCYQPSPDEAPLGFDNQVPFIGQSDLQSTDEGKTFSSVYSTGTGVYGNWMVGLNLTSPDERPIPVTGYQVSFDGKDVTTEPQTATSYAYDFGKTDDKMHNVRVDAVYADYGRVRGGVTYFKLGVPSGIDETVAATFHLTATGGVLTVEGAPVSELTAYAADGRLMGSAQGNQLNISHFAPGTYVVNITLTDGSRRSCKFAVVR